MTRISEGYLSAAFDGVRRPYVWVLALTFLIAIVLLVVAGPRSLAQSTLYGLVTASYYALGAVGLTLVYGILRLVNLAHGDFLTLGAYMALGASAGLGWPLIGAVLVAVAATAVIGVLLERVLWRPLRSQGASFLPLILASIGLAFVIRNGIQLAAGTTPQRLEVDVTTAVSFLGLRLGRTQMIVMVVGFIAVVLVAMMLRFTTIGRQMRALADSRELAETTGIDTDRITTLTWVFAGGLAGLAGVLYGAAIGTIEPNIGFTILLALFAAVVLGGIGNAYGALAAAVVLGLAQEWSVLIVAPQWKMAVAFALLIVTLLLRPHGILGRERTVGP